jgi:integrase
MYRIYKRGEVWWVRLNGERISTKQRSEAAAHAFARDLERRAADPDYAASHQATLTNALTALFTELVRRKRSAATIAIVKQKAGHLLRLLPAQLALVDANAVDAYIAQREAEGAKPLTVTKELSALRQALKLAIRRGEYKRTVEQVMPVSYSPEYAPRERWIPHEELVQLLAALPAKRAAHVAFIVATSARWGESVRARRGDIDLVAGVVHVRGTKTKASKRTVPILPMFRDLLEQALRDAPGRGDEPLFEPWANVRRDLFVYCTGHLPTPNGQPGECYISSPAGIAPCTPNDLRRTTATWLRRAGVEPHLIAAVLGHTTSTMVEKVYGRIDADALGQQITSKTGSGSVPPVYRQSVSLGTQGEDDMRKTLENSSRLGDLNPRPAVYETSAQTYANALKEALECAGSGGLVPSVYRRHIAALSALLDEVAESTGGKAAAS